MDFRSAAVNVVWAGTSLRAWRDFRRALRNPADIQKRLLLRDVARNRDSVFGRAHGFATIRSVEDYQARVPLSTYDDFEPFIHGIVGGQQRVLTEAPVQCLVPSGGSTAAAKLIPFTAALRRDFSRAIDAWLADLFIRYPPLLGGPAYWSITPLAATGPATCTSAVPIGFEDDSRYLGGARHALAKAIMAVPTEIVRVRDITVFRYATLLFLLRARELRLISVWHPSFLDGLLEVFEEHRDRLLHDMAAGTFSPPVSFAREDVAPLLGMMRPDGRRASDLRAGGSLDWRAIWPKLSLISCWGDGLSHGPARLLANRAGGVPLQPKGLLATEGVVTIPFAGRHPIAVLSHFYEFVDSGGHIRLGHELSPGEEYGVVISTSGGLYRYRLGDRVRVDGYVDQTPSLRFIGKDDRVSDWFGEKLSDGFVAGVLQSLFSAVPMPCFALLAPERTSAGVAYTLFLDSEVSGPDLDARLERALRHNPQYAWCVDLGQLRPARVVRVGQGAGQAYIDACVARGQRLGDIKPSALRSETGWADVLPCLRTAEAASC